MIKAAWDFVVKLSVRAVLLVVGPIFLAALWMQRFWYALTDDDDWRDLAGAWREPERTNMGRWMASLGRDHDD